MVMIGPHFDHFVRTLGPNWFEGRVHQDETGRQKSFLGNKNIFWPKKSLAAKRFGRIWN